VQLFEFYLQVAQNLRYTSFSNVLFKNAIEKSGLKVFFLQKMTSWTAWRIDAGIDLSAGGGPNITVRY